MAEEQEAELRLAQVSEATGLSPLVIRAWERRYGFPSATRTEGGHRRYTTGEAAALHRAALLVRSGFRPAEAIRRAQREAPAAADATAGDLVDVLVGDDPGTAIARLRGLELTVGFEQALETAVLPAMRRIGERWAAGAGGIADEHVATSAVQGWMGLVRAGHGEPPAGAPSALVVSAPGELHELPALILEALLARRGIQSTSIGANLPPEAVVAAIRERRPDAVVISCVHHELKPEPLAELVAAVHAAAPGVAVYAGGPGPRPRLTATELPLDLPAAADLVASELRAGRS